VVYGAAVEADFRHKVLERLVDRCRTIHEQIQVGDFLSSLSLAKQGPPADALFQVCLRLEVPRKRLKCFLTLLIKELSNSFAQFG
jgi:hypothetical protein